MIDVVVSVPHSGTRTLVEYLGLGKNSPRGRWMHFGYDPDEPRIKSGKYHLHIPIRDPIDVTRSWARRNKNVDALVDAYLSMFDHMQTQEHTIHRMEVLPKLDGHDEYPDQAAPAWRMAQYQDTVMEDVIIPNQAFFEKYYG